MAYKKTINNLIDFENFELVKNVNFFFVMFTRVWYRIDNLFINKSVRFQLIIIALNLKQYSPSIPLYIDRWKLYRLVLDKYRNYSILKLSTIYIYMYIYLLVTTRAVSTCKSHFGFMVTNYNLISVDSFFGNVLFIGNKYFPKRLFVLDVKCFR